MAAKLARVLRLAVNTRHTFSVTKRLGHGSVPSLRLYSVVPGSPQDDWPSEILKPGEDVDEGSYHHELKPWEDVDEGSYQHEFAGAHGPIGPDGLPTYVDWRVAGAVTPVQSQGNCGSCWAFATAAAVEGVNFNYTGQLVKVSEQQLLDCNNIGNFGCCNGSVREAFKYIIRTGGIVEAKYYPYVARQNICQRILAPAVTIDSYKLIVDGTEFDLLKAIATQPTCVMVKVDDRFKHYKGRGILSGPSYDFGELNHYITMVAYDPDCIIGKNSWGTGFGDGGYVRIARGVNCPGGAFGITRWIIYPTKRSDNRVCQIRSDIDMGLRLKKET